MRKWWRHTENFPTNWSPCFYNWLPKIMADRLQTVAMWLPVQGVRIMGMLQYRKMPE